jgi:AcrR family transcriptional regulator
MSGKTSQNRRTQRTRAALLGAFNQLFLSGRRGRVRVAEIVAEAEVGRSTFYEHYSGADDIHLEAMRRPLAALADAAAGLGDEPALERLLTHFWDNRQRARESLSGRFGDRVSRLLAGMIEERIEDAALSLPPRLAARALGDAALAPLRPWLSGEAAVRPAQLASAILLAGAGLRSALEAPQVQSAR